MSRPTVCPNSDHDGTAVPVTRHIEAVPVDPTRLGPSLIEGAWCEYCAEGQVAKLVRRGYRVTVWAPGLEAQR